MTKIGFFIIPNIQISKKIINYKKKVKTIFGKQIYLNHFPHITIGVLDVNKEFFQNFKLNKKKLKKLVSSKYLSFYQPFIFRNDLLANNGNTIVYEIKKFKWFQDFQIEIFNQLQIYRVKNTSKISFNQKWIKNNNMLYGYPYVGDYWKPHITISSILVNKNNDLYYRKFEDVFLNEKVNFKQKIDNISFFKINNNSHKLIKKYSL
tara:strand:+ start:6279 stop:6896 length:618 start_codon:yes stop_codon:yes gene_type:complete